MVGTRTKDDIQWQDLKKLVKERDKTCIFRDCLTPAEAMYAPSSRGVCDPAHVFEVSSYPEIMYEPRNVVYLSRTIHGLMDSMKNPVTTNYLTDVNEHYYWWWRITQHAVVDYDPNENYKSLVWDWVTKGIGIKQEKSEENNSLAKLAKL